MKKRKILSLLLSLCLLISLLPTVALAADQTNDGAGIRIQYVDGSYDKTTGIMKVRVQAKMPAGTGITTIGTLLSWDNTKLAVVNQYKTSQDLTAPDGTLISPAAAAVKAIMTTESVYGAAGAYSVANGDIYSSGNRSALYTYLYNASPDVNKPTDAQTGGNWFDVYEVMFRVTGQPDDPATVLNSDSLRIADTTKGDDAVMKGAFPANNIYSIYLTDNSDPAKLYVLNRMSGCSATEVTGEKSLMTAPDTGTATYPGSTNPVTPPAPATLTGIAVKKAPDKVTYNEGDSFDKTGMVIEATYSDTSKKNVTTYTYTPTGALTTSDTTISISYTEDGVTKTCTQGITVNAVTPPATKTLSSIVVKTAPDKVDYTEGETFDATGMVIEATYSDSSKKDVTTYTYAPTAALTTSDTEVTISYTEGGVTKTCTQAITVNAVTPPAPTEYTITFNGNGGTPSAGTMSTIGGKLTSLSTATRSGSYSFDGWYTAASGGTQITTAYTFSANTTVYAHWTYTGGGGGSYYAPTVPDMPMLYRGCTGDAVKTLQDKLNALGYNSGNVDGIFGAKTYAAVTAFQKANNLGVDGIVGKLTWAKLYDATPVNVTPVTTQPMLRTGSRGDAVRKLQELLNAKGYTCGSVDGIFGSKTYAAVLAFQKANGLAADGIVGPLTWGKLV